MKKVFYVALIVFNCVPVTLNAQFRVNQNGNISIQSTKTPLSTISISEAGDTTMAVYYKGPKYGFYSYTVGGSSNWGNGAEFNSKTDTYNFSVGVKGTSSSLGWVETNRKRAFGVFGEAGYATNGWNYGVFGRINGTSNGAGIYGTSNASENGTYLSRRYAGYFNGEVGISGDLIVSGSIIGVLLGSSANALSTTQTFSTDNTQESTSDKLSGLSAISFYKSTSTAAIAAAVPVGDTIATARQMTQIEAQDLTKMHYALSAEQLEEVYPELVYENGDGSKSINYMEMIPLLVQSINELNAKISRLENENGNLRMATKSNGATGIDGGVDIVTAASLSQNDPNPFGYSTSIKMNIPTNTKNAILSIYDMSGKQLKQITITERGETEIQITSEGLAAGMYMYSLIVDGKLVNTKRMIIAS